MLQVFGSRLRRCVAVWWAGFIVGLLVGLIGGVVGVGLCHSAADSDLATELEYEKLMRQKAEREVKYYRQRMIELAAKLGVREYEQKK